MRSSLPSIDLRPEAPRGRPYVLAVASHKGGTGRTTAALALAWHWRRAGLAVTLVDADPSGAALLIAAGGRRGADARRYDGPASLRAEEDDIVVVDCPPLHEAAGAVLRRADGVVWSCVADPMCLRTLPLATRAVASAQDAGGRPQVVGVLLNMFDPADPLQARLRQDLEAAAGDLLLAPPVPLHPSARDWASSPGADFPAGPAYDAYAALAEALAEKLGVGVAAGRAGG